MKTRPLKATDQDQTQKAYLILIKLIDEHPEIEKTLWAGALISTFVIAHKNSGYDYNEFCNILNELKIVYKFWFEK